MSRRNEIGKTRASDKSLNEYFGELKQKDKLCIKEYG